MIQVLKNNEQPSFLESILGGLSKSGPQAFQQYFKAKNQKDLDDKSIKMGSKLVGFDLSGFDPETRKNIVIQRLKQQGDERLLGLKQTGAERLQFFDQIGGGAGGGGRGGGLDLSGSRTSALEGELGEPEGFRNAFSPIKGAFSSKQDISEPESAGVAQDNNQEQEEPSEKKPKKEFSPLDLSDEFIARQQAIDLPYGNALRKSKDEALKRQDKQEVKDKEKQDLNRLKDTAQTSFNSLAKILKKKNIGVGSEFLGSVVGGETSKDVGHFQSASGGLESILVDMVSRGTLSNARFKYITETLLPKPTDRQATIEGKLRGLADLLDLDSSELSKKGSKAKSTEKLALEDIWE